MYQEERIQAILSYLGEHKRISVEEICSLCNVSRDTARRDLVKLEEKGAILRTRGGALLPTITKDIKSYEDRLYSDLKEKRAIGKLAASLVKDGDKIVMDTATTVQACAEYLQADNCTVITNSINQADILSNKTGVNIHLLGGQLNQEQRFLYGPSVLSMLSNYYVDKAFIGTCGLTEDGAMVAFEEDGVIMKKMIEQADQVILLVDSSKFGKKGFFKFADLSQIDIIITDRLPNKELMEGLNQYEINVMVAK